jgi:hypothetical protein
MQVDMISGKILKFAVLFFVFVAFTGSAAADTLTLSSGQVYKGKITAEEEGRIQIKLESSGVRLWFSRDQILDFNKTNPEKPEDEEKAKPKPTSDSPPLDEDVARARALLEKMRAEQPDASKLKNNKKGRGKTTEKPQEEDAKPKVELVTYTDEEVDALIEKMRFAKSIYDRRNACVELGKTGSMQAIPHLIHLLEHESPMMRKAGNDSLKQITKEDFGFDPVAKGNVRAWAIDKWKKWHKEIKDEDARSTLKSLF